MSRRYDIGDEVRCWGRFYDSDSALADPTAVYVSYRKPSGVLVELQYSVDADVIKDGTGEYYVDLDVDEPGRWHVRWFSTGSYKAAEESSFLVDDAVAR